jgi:hypothetical protein
MRVEIVDISGISRAVRRHEALLRYVRYLLIFNIAIFLWFVMPQLAQVTSFGGLGELVTGPAWQWAALVLGSLAATYLILAHRLWLAYAVIFLAQVGYYFLVSSPDKTIFYLSAMMTYGVIFLPPMRPLGPLVAELAIMTIAFSYMMLVCCIYSAAWTARARRVPRCAYGPRLSPFVLVCSIPCCRAIDRRTSRSPRRPFSHFLRCCSWRPRWPRFTASGECRIRS